jgi:hypothetical protein
MEPIDVLDETRLELFRLDELDDGEFTAPYPDELPDDESDATECLFMW